MTMVRQENLLPTQSEQIMGLSARNLSKKIIETGFDKIKEIHNDFVNRISEKDTLGEKEGKQIQPIALILTADKLFTDLFMHDGVYLDFDFCYSLIRSNKAMSDNERAYEFIINEVAINRNNFRDDDIQPVQRWGYIQDGYYLINPNIFSGIAERGNF